MKEFEFKTALAKHVDSKRSFWSLLPARLIENLDLSVTDAIPRSMNKNTDLLQWLTTVWTNRYYLARQLDACIHG